MKTITVKKKWKRIVEKPTKVNQKEEIAELMKETMKEKRVSLSILGEKTGLPKAQLSKITNGSGYNIDTLFKILDGLDLELTIKPKGE